MKKPPLLKLESVSKRFRGVKAIENCSFSVPQGEVTAIIGPNGSGKTTLLNIISGFVTPQKGKVTFKNLDITNLKPYKLYQLGIARTFQKSRLFYDLTTRENLSLGKVDISKALEIMNDMGITECNKAISTLSGGQQRIVEIIRAITSKCELILLDEPFSGLHYENKLKIAQLIKDQCKLKTFLIIDHDLDMILSISREIILLKNGNIIKNDKIENINQEKIMEMMYDAKN